MTRSVGALVAARSPLPGPATGPRTQQLVRGTGDDDELYGTSGADILQGLGGEDSLEGLGGDDQLEGGMGDDALDGGTGNDTLDGGGGNDAAVYLWAAGPVQANLGAGWATGADGNDTLRSIEDLYGSFYDDELVGSDDDNFIFGYFGNDRIDGGAGDGDMASFLSGIEEVVVRHDPVTGWLTITSPYEGTDQVRQVESLYFYLDVFETEVFTTPAAPHPIAYGPSLGDTAVPVGSDLRITFQEPIRLGSGAVVLRDAAGREVERFDAASSARLRVEGMNLVVDPTQPLLRASGYTLELLADAVVDEQGLGNLPDAAYRFTTRSAVEVNLPAQVNADEGPAAVPIRVSLSDPATGPVQVTVSLVADGLARVGRDFVVLSQTVRFEPGQTEQWVNLALVDDGIVEPDETLTLRLGGVQGAVLGQSTASVLIRDDDAPPGMQPTDPLARLQWHLYPETGANVLAVWPDYTGAGVRVGVFDQGIDATHPDLRTKVDLAAGRRTADGTPDGAPRGPADNHGTAVAGVIGAARNDLGGIGVAHGATLVSLYSPLDATSTTREIENAFGFALQLDVLNDSWGYAPQYYLDEPWAFEDNFLDPEFAASGAALKRLAEEGRGGLGTVVVQSAGNSFEFGDDTNLHNFQNSRYIITVAATGPEGRASGYTSPGASVLVAAPGGSGDALDDPADILTTDRPGTAGYDPGDSVRLAGTSFSAPVVSGVVALMLEANPLLGFRDVQQILAFSAHLSDVERNDWRSNGATQWNGGGLHYDAGTHDLGFGLVDARAAVRLAESWGQASATAANDVELALTSTTAAAIPDGQGSVSQTLRVTESLRVERVEVTVDIAHDYIGDLTLQLMSPAGTQSWLLSRPGQNTLSAFGNDQADIHFTFNTVLSWGESSLGDWTLVVQDEADRDAGR